MNISRPFEKISIKDFDRYILHTCLFAISRKNNQMEAEER